MLFAVSSVCFSMTDVTDLFRGRSERGALPNAKLTCCSRRSSCKTGVSAHREGSPSTPDLQQDRLKLFQRSHGTTSRQSSVFFAKDCREPSRRHVSRDRPRATLVTTQSGLFVAIGTIPHKTGG